MTPDHADLLWNEIVGAFRRTNSWNVGALRTHQPRYFIQCTSQPIIQNVRFSNQSIPNLWRTRGSTATTMDHLKPGRQPAASQIAMLLAMCIPCVLSLASAARVPHLSPAQPSWHAELPANSACAPHTAEQPLHASTAAIDRRDVQLNMSGTKLRFLGLGASPLTLPFNAPPASLSSK